ncbi:MAG: class I SAM-dependent rRNA methyltransferase [Clostridia bacterium]|nr:class I SAM-dependent rRNA methyltransferase [Clostridia bacterium]
MSYTLYLKKGEEKRILAGHSWVYANEVQKIEGKDKNGSLATVLTWDGKFIGKGYINHLSKIIVRIFIREDVEDTKELYLERLKRAYDARRALGYDNCFRLCFAESDDLPALIIDKYADVLSVQFLSLGMDMRKGLIVDCLKELFNPKGIYERSDVNVRLKEGLKLQTGVLYGEVPEKVIIEENGIKIAVDIRSGQKTGYFLDQKENRLAARKYCNDKTVLDCFSNTGGFSLNVATVAKEVTAVDISQKAIDSVNENKELNGFTNLNTVCDDVFEVLRRYRQEGKTFGTVILDPPAFTKSASEIKDAIRGYTDINVLGLKLVEKGGYLITSSCSHYVNQQAFERMLIDSARIAKRRVKCLEIKSQAPDHPYLLCAEETSYLKFFVLQVD